MDFTSLASMFGMGGGGAGAGAGASVAPPDAASAFNGTNANYGPPTQQGQGALNYLGNAAMNKAMSGGGTGGQMGGFSDTNGSGGVGSGGSGGYAGGKL